MCLKENIFEFITNIAITTQVGNLHLETLVYEIMTK